MKNVATTVEIAVETMSTHNIVLYVNAWIQMTEVMEQLKLQLNHLPNHQQNHQLNLQLMLAELLIGLAITI